MPISESRKRLNAFYRRVIHRGLAPTLRRHGFDRDAGIYRRFVGKEVVWAVYPSRPPRWSQPGEVCFTIDIGVLVTAIEAVFPESKVGYHPASTAVQIRAGVDDLSGENKHKSWCIRDSASETELSALESEITRAFETHVLPWFGQFQSACSVADYLASPEPAPGLIRRGYRDIPQDAGDLRNAAIAYFGAGNFERAREMLDLAMTTIDRCGKDHTVDLRARIERLIGQRSADRAKR